MKAISSLFMSYCLIASTTWGDERKPAIVHLTLPSSWSITESNIQSKQEDQGKTTYVAQLDDQDHFEAHKDRTLSVFAIAVSPNDGDAKTPIEFQKQTKYEGTTEPIKAVYEINIAGEQFAVSETKTILQKYETIEKNYVAFKGPWVVEAMVVCAVRESCVEFEQVLSKIELGPKAQD
ncbi:hypothetical protein [Spartinivicinus poritis]|uniref:Uncharacterized protein n=1 Tax=Spartinivicinus poritis TaxID=2994640 RepID=A0ABT5UDN7_9GAMM|nr:hypothetical protein [Spartinivicinus sp. A2-2]MDE1463588.1 hypothetical protein [Spartinivicinus sp. A2-2]